MGIPVIIEMAWAVAVVGCAVALLAAPASVSCLASLVLAAGWSIRLDREEHAVQVVESEGFALNR